MRMTHQPYCLSDQRNRTFGSRKHRLRCGDATAVTDVEHLMRETRLTWSSPSTVQRRLPATPINISRSKELHVGRPFQRFSRHLGSYRMLASPQFRLYVSSIFSLQQREFQNCVRRTFQIRCQSSGKNTSPGDSGRYKFQHEPVFFARPSERRLVCDNPVHFMGGEQAAANRIHPTAKPSIVERALGEQQQAE